MVGTCEVAKIPEYCVDAPMPAAQAKHSKPGPLKLVLPPNPCQRPIGTSASNSISSEIFAKVTVFGQLISSTPSMLEIAQPRSRLVPKVPSLSLRSLKTGLVRLRAASVIDISCPVCSAWLRHRHGLIQLRTRSIICQGDAPDFIRATRCR